MFQPPATLVAEVGDRIRSADLISLFLDFDGTLAPISSDPAVPQLDADTAAILRLLASQDSLLMTIISGRAIEDLYTRIRLEGVIYAGNHGLEIFGRDMRFVEPLASDRREPLERLCEELELELRAVAGTFVERKGLTASIHYRQAAEADRPQILQIVYTAIARHGDLFRVNPGRKVFDIVPRTNWHKGAAVQWINARLETKLGAKPGGREMLTVYLGDDTSDEDAFSVLPDAVTIKVGEAPVTCARYQLPGPTEVRDFLRWLTHEVRSLPHQTHI
jgi:trehalose 6-phosphate phosphatase